MANLRIEKRCHAAYAIELSYPVRRVSPNSSVPAFAHRFVFGDFHCWVISANGDEEAFVRDFLHVDFATVFLNHEVTFGDTLDSRVPVFVLIDDVEF